jgi:PAS domain S-box-containing protein/diguanylate cyclase (GGDEF)-like protein
MQDELPRIKHKARNIALIYALFSSIWILSSDWLLKLLIHNDNLQTIQIGKDWIFVLITSRLLYGLVKRGLRSAQASYNLLQAITQGTTEAIFVKNLQGRYLTINPAGARILGKAIEEIIGKDDAELFPPEIAQKILFKDRQVIFSGQTQVSEDVIPVGNTMQTFLSTKDIYRNSQGKSLGLIGIARDITVQKSLLEQLKRKQERLQLQIDHMPLACIISDTELRTLDWNPAAETIFGYTKTEILGRNPCDFITPPAIHDKLNQIFQQLATGTTTLHGINENITKDGRIIICEWYNTVLTADGAVIGMLSMAKDITQQIHSEQELRSKDNLYRTLARNFPKGAVFLFDLDLRYTLAEGAGMAAMGLKTESFEGKTIWEALAPEICEMLEPIYRQALSGNATTFEAPLSDRLYLIQVLPVAHSSGEIYAGMSVMQDISDAVAAATQRKRTEAQLWRNAFYEPLTGLPNRALFLERLEQLILRAKHQEVGLFAVLLIQIERFDIVKYSLGHLVADQLIIAASRRLEQCLKPTDLLARLGSDEFVILHRNLQNIDDATSLAESLHASLTLPFDLDGREVFSTTHIGIALGGQNSTNKTPNQQAQDFLRAADIAMHDAKRSGKSRPALFNPKMQEQAVGRLQMEADLQRAVERQQFQVHYQPIVSLATGNITGFEALVRWIHPTRGMVSPAEFIPLAEETGLIQLIDRWVLREACFQLSAWQELFSPEIPLTMSVNLSSVQLAQLGLIERLDQIIKETGIQGHNLKLEITESAIMENATTGTVMLKQLKALGVQLSIDDFGTGYSSLARLHQLPIDTLKIDRSFVSQMGDDSESLEIVRTIITLAHSLEMDVIAEGVETTEEWQQLRSLNCEYAQGYFFSKPVACQAAEALLAK